MNRSARSVTSRASENLFSARSANDPQSDPYASNQGNQPNLTFGQQNGPLPAVGGTSPHEKESNLREQYGIQVGEVSDPLQLEHMLGYCGDYRKTVLCIPTNEQLFVRRYSFSSC
jgi:hypothetical protein